MPPPSTFKVEEIKFNGSNWQNLNRIVALARVHFKQDDDYDDSGGKKTAYLAGHDEGPALDWAATLSHDSAGMQNFNVFVKATWQAFGIAENNIVALRRRDLEQLE
ncbi:hypothetical protein SUNI508_13947 [Seiridium unicorne]|uniref:Uncharacterized protein n=1 Tax=Seiridium unicorne TaxID=138068 RepID=A0ABR2V9V4_9PEZI